MTPTLTIADSDLDLDLSTFPTKTAAAAIIGVKPKTIDRDVARGRLRKYLYSRPGLSQVTVIHPDDIERELQRRGREAVARKAAKVTGLPANVGKTPPAHVGMGHVAPPQTRGVSVGVSDLVAAALSRPTVLTFWPVYLTTEQAEQYVGLNRRHLNKLVEEGELMRVEDGLRSFRYRRTDLDNLKL